MKMTKFKNVEMASNINGLISIFCDHEKRGSEYYHEYFFLNNDFEVKAHFASTGVMRARQLSKLNNHIFTIKYCCEESNRKTQIVRVYPDLSYKVLHEVDYCRMFGMEGAAIKKNGLWGFIDYNGEVVIKPKYEDYSAFENKYIIEQKNICDYVKEQDEVVIPSKYKNITFGFIGGLAIAEYPDHKKGTDVINTKGEILYHAKMCNDVFNIGNGYILAENNNNEFEFIKLI